MTEKEQKYRHEMKYAVSAAQIPLLKSRICNLMQPDPHASTEGSYHIRSLYFDDYSNRCFYENENGTDPREKFRIRIYNRAAQRITLECKRKERGKTLKTSCSLTLEQAQQLIQGKSPALSDSFPPLLNRLLIGMRTHHLRPVVIVEYERMPYVYKNGNVRVTFDTQIASSSDIAGFFSERLPNRPVMPAGYHLMEVKFDEYLPDFIYRGLNLGTLRQTAFSKYYLCRKFTIHRTGDRL
ncbi:MAG: polyphosphate polymerase domain-containing protein [Oscillospiraceae bacterium]|nr:polyphosphate polymerase domain-containing protein [Oscillospiraceae bacterium]